MGWCVEAMMTSKNAKRCQGKVKCARDVAGADEGGEQDEGPKSRWAGSRRGGGIIVRLLAVLSVKLEHTREVLAVAVRTSLKSGGRSHCCGSYAPWTKAGGSALLFRGGKSTR